MPTGNATQLSLEEVKCRPELLGADCMVVDALLTLGYLNEAQDKLYLGTHLSTYHTCLPGEVPSPARYLGTDHI